MKRFFVKAVLPLAASLACVSASPAQTLQRRGDSRLCKPIIRSEHISSEIQFENDGTYDHQTTVRVRISRPLECSLGG